MFVCAYPNVGLQFSFAVMHSILLEKNTLSNSVSSFLVCPGVCASVCLSSVSRITMGELRSTRIISSVINVVLFSYHA